MKLEGRVFRLQRPEMALPSKPHVWNLSYLLHTVFHESQTYEREVRNRFLALSVGERPDEYQVGRRKSRTTYFARLFARPDCDNKHNLVGECICQSSAFLVGANPSRQAQKIYSLRPGLENMQLRHLGCLSC